jgi:hypothetical protein
MAPFVERRYVFTGNGVFVCKTNVSQHTSPPRWSGHGACAGQRDRRLRDDEPEGSGCGGHDGHLPKW